MKPTPEQQDYINEYLYGNLKYRATYNELFDHILTALDTIPEDVPFGNAMQIIIKDFGGTKAIRLMETEYRKASTKGLIKQYLGYMVQCCKSSTIILIVAGSILIYFFNKQAWFDSHQYLRLPLTLWMGIVPMMILAVKRRLGSLRKIEVENFYIDKKGLAVDVVIPYLSYLPIYIYLAGQLFFKDLSQHPYVLTIIFFVVTVHGLAYDKLLKKEFKANLIDNKLDMDINRAI